MSDIQSEVLTGPGRPFGWRQYWELFVRYLQPAKSRLPLLGVLVLTSIALQLLNPLVIRYFLDTAESGGSQRALFAAAALFILFAVVQNLIELAATYTNQVVSWQATNHLRSDLARHCLGLDLAFHKKTTPGELIERVDRDVNRLGEFFSQLFIRLLGHSLLVIGILVMLFLVNTALGWIMLLYAVITLAVLSVLQRPAARRWEVERQASAEMSGFIEERISGAEEIRAIGAEDYAVRGLLLRMQAYLVKNRAASLVNGLSYHLTDLITVIGYTVGLAWGVYLYLAGQATIGTAYLVVFYIGLLSEPLQGIREQSQNLQQATASLRRIQAMFNQRSFTATSANQAAVPMAGLPPAGTLTDGALSVTLEDVSFRYEQENVLQGISFHLAAGATLGVLGRTGSGKSTLSRLLARLYDPQQGEIRLGQVDLRSVALPELRRKVGLVTQEVQLFDASIRDNLTFFDPSIGDAQLQSALEELGLWGWVRSLPQGLDTRLSAGGQGLSAGEAQLLTFGRLLLRDPGLVILDEASSRLDPSTEALMELAIDRLFRGRSGIIIAHRLRTVQRADEILILQDGQVQEYGQRQALAADPDSRYSQLLVTGLEAVLV